MNAPLAGLDSVPKELHPPVEIVFWSFRIMVAIGFAMLGLGLWSLWCRLRGTLHENRWLHRAALAMAPAGFIAVLAGWVTTEVGRQPYTVYGHLLTANSVAPIDAPAVATSLIAFIIVYFLVFGAGTFYILRLMGRLPRDPEPDLQDGPIRTAGITPAPAIANKPGSSHHGL
jgi:cytochrome d ubiquinol oxidase subunit I